ncbi:MAG: O-antigen ligase family protein, partial [Terriglobales bacterium]
VPLVAYAAIVTICGASQGGLREAFGSFMTLRPLVVYFIAYDVFSRNKQLQGLSLGLLLVVSAVAGLWGTFQQLSGYHPFGFQYLQGVGFLSGPMAFAGQMQLFALMAVGLALTGGFEELPGKLKDYRVFFAVAVANVLGLIFASERSAWLGFLVAGTVAGALISGRTAAKILAAGSGLAAVAWFTVPVFQKRLLPLLDWYHEVSSRARLEVWEKAWAVFKQHPVLGCGPRNFPHVYIPEALVPGQARYLAHAHSNYLHALATTGVVGFCFFIWLSLASLKLAFDQFINPESKFRRGVGLGLFAGLISLAIAGFFEYNFGTGQVRLAQWYLLAFLIPRRSAD